MIPRKYHAITFVSILVMLLLLGLHLLGFGLLAGSGASSQPAASAALARNSTSSSLLSLGANSQQGAYKHPISYDKLTGATNNQISEVLGAPRQDNQQQLPLGHYQQARARLQQNPFGIESQFGPPISSQQQSDVLVDPFGPHLPDRRQFGPPPPPPPTHFSGHLPPPPPLMTQQLPPPPRQQQLSPTSRGPFNHAHHHHLMTTQAPEVPQQQQRSNAQLTSGDSIPSASSVNNASNASPNGNYAIAQQPVYYTPPIFTYSNNNYDLAPPTHAQQQQQQQPPPPGYYSRGPPPPPVGVPEAPLSVDEYAARQSRLRNEPPGDAGKGEQQQQQQQVNLLADPAAQQRHKQQMLDRQLLFGPSSPGAPVNYPPPPPRPHLRADNNSAQYPDPAVIYGTGRGGPQTAPPPPPRRAPYAHQVHDSAAAVGAHSEVAPPQQLPPRPPPPAPLRQSSPVAASSPQVRGQSAPLTRLPPTQEALPTCARQQGVEQQVNGSSVSFRAPALFCNDDSDYPTPEIMRALENFAAERSIEQILPQQLVQLLVANGATQNPRLAELQRQLSLDSLQPNINAQTISGSVASSGPNELASSDQQQLFPSNGYESLCKAAIWMAQPRRARNLLGQWKVVVNLPGHKYRGIAISQMVRIEECTRPGGECAPASLASPATTPEVQKSSPAANQRCLQLYENQRLLAWSHQQGLHFDLFRTPSACSCHIVRRPS